MALGISYNPYGPYVYNRNAQPLALPDLGGMQLNYNWGGGGSGGSPDTTVYQPGASPLEVGKSIFDAAKTAKDVNDLVHGRGPIAELFGGGSAALGPSSAAALQGTVTGPGGLLAGGGATSLGSEAAGALSMPAGFAPAGLGVIGPSEALAAASTATGPGGLLVGGGGTSLAGAGAAAEGAAAAGAGSLGATLGASIPPLLAMYAIMQLGGAFDPPTPRMGVTSDININPDGTLSAPNFIDQSNYGMTAPQDYYNNAQTVYGALQDKIASGQIDPSWMQPGAGLLLGYGSDEGIGLMNPQAFIHFRSGNTTPEIMGSEGTMSGGNPLDINWYTLLNNQYSTNSLNDLVDMINTRDLPLFSAAPTYQNLPLDIFANQLSMPPSVLETANIYKQANPDLADGRALELAMQAWDASNRS